MDHTFSPLTENEWEKVRHLFPHPIKRSRGKPHAPWRVVMNSILLVLCTGTKWEQIPKDPAFATKSVAHRWFALWDKSGLLYDALELLKHDRSCFDKIAIPPRRNRLTLKEKQQQTCTPISCSLIAAHS